MGTMTIKGKTMRSVDVDWNEFYYTNCPLVSPSNVDQEIGWVKEEFKKIDIAYKFLRSTRENDWYPHYVHNLDNLMRYGGCNPAIHVQADVRRTRLIGTTHVYEGGCMLVRARDPIYRMKDLKGKKIGLSKSLNVIKNDWWRVQEEQGIELMLMLNDMTRDDVEIVEFPYPDDWYDKPEMLTPMENPSELWLKRDHKHDLAFRPLETALLKGVVDAIYTQSKVFQHISGADRQAQGHREPGQLSRLDSAGGQRPGDLHGHRCGVPGAPRADRHAHEGSDQGGTLGQRAQARRGGHPGQADLLPGCRGHLPRHPERRHGAQPVALQPASPADQQGLHAAATATSSMTSMYLSGLRRNSLRRRRRSCSRKSGRSAAWPGFPKRLRWKRP